MAITDEQAIKFSNEIMRPKSETLRNTYWEFKSIAVDWVNTYGDLFPNDASEVVMDDRSSESDLTGEDVHAFKDAILAFLIMMEEPGVLNAIQKPCVRHLEA